jgi:type III pantothenate kinase
MAAARLPRVSLKPLSEKKSIIGKNTVSAMESGIFWGYVSMIEGLIQKIKTNEKLINHNVIATGGLSHLFKKSLNCVDEIIDDLTLIGLVHLYLKNKSFN